MIDMKTLELKVNALNQIIVHKDKTIRSLRTVKEELLKQNNNLREQIEFLTGKRK